MATPEAISGRTFASRKSTARTTRGTNKSPTKSTVAFRLGAVARIQRPYVLRCGDKWLSSEMARSLTADISQAGLSEDASAMEALGRKLSDAFHPKYWPERLQLEQLSCTVEGLVTGSGPLTDYEAPPPLDWPSSKLHNAALAETAWFEASDGGEALHAHSFMLKASAMWPLVQKQYEAELENDALESLPQHKDLALPMFAARMLYAGIVMGRRERDRRTVHGDLALDFPATPARRTRCCRSSGWCPMKRAIEELNRSRFQPLTCHDPLRDGFVHIALIVDAQEFRRPPSAEPQQFAGYAVKVRLTEEVAEGDLVLASVPSGELRLLKATESMEFTEVVSEEPVSRVKVLGVVVEEQHFMTQEQRDNFPSSA